MTDIEKLEKFKNITIHYGNTFGMHIEQLKEIQEAIGNVLSDLYEANNRINDLLDIEKQKDRMIDLMAQAIDNYDSQLEINSYRDKDEIIEAFKEAMARRDFREKKRKEFEERCK